MYGQTHRTHPPRAELLLYKGPHCSPNSTPSARLLTFWQAGFLTPSPASSSPAWSQWGTRGGTHGTAGWGRDRAVEPSSPAQVPSPHLTAHPGHRPPPTGVLGWAVGGLTRPEAHAAAPQPALCRCLRAALACLNVPGGHKLLAVLGGSRGGSQQQASALSSPRGTAFWRPLGVAGADGGLSASFLLGCSPSAQPRA